MKKQLSLDWAWEPLTPTFDNFYCDDEHRSVITYLKAIASGQHYDVLTHLWGGPGCGRTHVLQAVCEQARRCGYLSCYVSFNRWQQHGLSSSWLQSLEYSYLVALDDFDHILGHLNWEQACVDLYHRLQERQHSLVISTRCPIHQLSCQLRDWMSRLCGGATFMLHGLSDDQKLLLLQRYAWHYGLELSPTTGQFLLNHHPRNLMALLSNLERLNQAAWLEQRRITIPFIKEHSHPTKDDPIQS